LPSNQGRPCAPNEGEQQSYSQIQEITASQAAYERNRHLFRTARLHGRHAERFISVQRKGNHLYFPNAKQSTSQWEARSHEVVPSALVHLKGGGASESHDLPPGPRKLWFPCRRIHTFHSPSLLNSNLPKFLGHFG
jgi:hypothetical protein